MNDKELAAELLVALYRRDCPDSLELGEYQLSLLAETERTRLQAHLARCPYCQAELTHLGEFLAEDALRPVPAPTGAGPSWTQERDFKWRLGEAKQVIIQLLAEALNPISSSLAPPLGPLAYATARRGSNESHRILGQLSLEEAGEELEVRITAELRRGNPAQCTVTIDVNIPSRGGWPHLADTEVTLKRNEVALTTRTTDAFGQAVFEEIATDDLAQLAFEITPRT